MRLQRMEIIRKQANMSETGCFSFFSSPLPPNTDLTMLFCSFSCKTQCYNEYKHWYGTLCCTETRSPFPLTLTCCKPSASSETCLGYTPLLHREGREETYEACLVFHGDLRMAYPSGSLNRNHNPFNYVGVLPLLQVLPFSTAANVHSVLVLTVLYAVRQNYFCWIDGRGVKAGGENGRQPTSGICMWSRKYTSNALKWVSMHIIYFLFHIHMQHCCDSYGMGRFKNYHFCCLGLNGIWNSRFHQPHTFKINQRTCFTWLWWIYAARNQCLSPAGGTSLRRSQVYSVLTMTTLLHVVGFSVLDITNTCKWEKREKCQKGVKEGDIIKKWTKVWKS